MKLFGQSVSGPNVDHLVLPRAEYDLVISAQAILDDEILKTLLPRPKPPKIHKPGQENWEDNVNDPDYKKALDLWARRRSAWTILESLKATPKETLEWETVKLDDPTTWEKWDEELRQAFFTGSEIVSIMNLVWSVNGMNQDKLDEARIRFLAGRRRVKVPTSPTVEQQNTPSGEPAKE